MGFVNENIALAVPALTLESGDIAGSLTLPAFTLSAADASGYGALTLGALTASSGGDVGSAGTAELVFAALAPQGSGTTGGIGSAALSFKSLTLTADGGRSPGGAVTLPAFTLAATGGAPATWDAALSLPAMQLVSHLVSESAAHVTTTTDYVVWVVNEQTGDHSTYTNWLINSYAEINGAQFVATPTGIYQLTGGTDAGTNIDSKVYWVPSLFGTTRQKRTDQAFLRIRAGGNVRLIAWTDEVEKRIYGQNMTGFPTNLHPKRVPLTRKLQGALWQFGFENVNGSDFDLHDIEVDIVVLTRRLK